MITDEEQFKINESLVKMAEGFGIKFSSDMSALDLQKEIFQKLSPDEKDQFLLGQIIALQGMYNRLQAMIAGT